MLLYLFCNKSHYENVPFEIPENWVWCKLDDLAFYKKGPFGSSLTKSMFIPDNGNAYKVYEQKNAIQKDSNLGHYFISGEKFQELKGFEVLPNDIIVSCAGTIGETYIMPSDIRSGIINQALMIIRLHNIDITPFYLLYFDFILKNEAGKDGKGTAIKNIPPFDILKNYWIPLPPLAEQDRIIKEVALWQCLIDSIDGNIEDIFKLSKKTKSKILDLAISGKLVPQDPNDKPAIELLKRINPDFQPCDNSHYENLPQGWVVCRLEDVCQICDNQRQPINSTERQERKKRAQTLYPYYGATGQVDWIDDYMLDGTFILLGEDGAPFLEKFADKAYVVSGKIWVNNHAHILKPNCDITYLTYYLNRYDYSKCVNGSTRLKLTQADMKNMTIVLPPLVEQHRIAGRIENIFRMLDAITAEL